MTIDIGDVAIIRSYQFTNIGYTLVNKGNPADASGTIHSVEIYAVAGHNLTNVVVGTFYTTNGNTLKCRDSAVIGTVASGSKQIITEDSESNPLAIAVESGDYIGIYYAEGWLYWDDTGFSGTWYKLGQYADPGDEITYSMSPGGAISLYGEGEEPAKPAAGGGPAVLVAAGII